MEEFLKINWRPSLSLMEKQLIFMTDEELASSYIQKGLQQASKQQVKLPKPNECYIPGRKLFDKKRSKLTKTEQLQCLNALKCFQSGKDMTKLKVSEQRDMEMYNKLRTKIIEENAEYLKHAKNIWVAANKRLSEIKSSVRQYAENRWRDSLSRCMSYAELYEEIKKLPLSYAEDDIPIEVINTSNLLEVGTVAKCFFPTLKSEVVLRLSTLPSQRTENLTNSKLPVSQDKNIDKLIRENDIDVVTSAACLNRLLDGATEREWDIPVIIKLITTERGIKKIVYLDKPLPVKSPTYAYFNQRCSKLMLRTNFCKQEAFRYPAAEIPLPEQDIHVEKCDNQETVNNQQSSLDKETGNTVHHNVSYRLWNFNQKHEHNELMKTRLNFKGIKVLIRNKLDGCVALEDNLQPIMITPKIEYQLQFGGNIPKRSELTKEWSSLFFHPYSKLYRTRIDSKTLTVVHIEELTVPKVNSEAIAHHNYKPYLGLGAIYRIFSELTKLEEGNYVLHYVPKYEQFVAVYKEVNIRKDECLNLHDEYKYCTPAYNVTSPWCPIDVNLILPMHIAYGRLPGMFLPCTKKVTFKKGAKKNKIKKEKNKASCNTNSLLI